MWHQSGWFLIFLLSLKTVVKSQNMTICIYFLFPLYFIFKYLYILSIHNEIDMKTCIWLLLSVCALLHTLSLLSYFSSISHTSNPLPICNLLRIYNEQNQWWRPYILVWLPTIISRYYVVWHPRSELDGCQCYIFIVFKIIILGFKSFNNN